MRRHTPVTDAVPVRVAFGYIRVPLGCVPGFASAPAVVLASFAATQGWVLAETFVEDDANRPLLAFTSLLVAARFVRPVAVLVADPGDLGSSTTGALALRVRIEHEVGAPVLVASVNQPAPVVTRRW